MTRSTSCIGPGGRTNASCARAQGTFLDLDSGDLPVRHLLLPPSRPGRRPDLGLPRRRRARWFGVCKAYTTRVGEGPFPTELLGEEGEDLRQRGGEYGGDLAARAGVGGSIW
ncbi:MAG: adenylosuccinate synthetase [Chromatiales bacterium]|nr:adenylosuccinate synthetase [Chromatiales bacterium]